MARYRWRAAREWLIGDGWLCRCTTTTERRIIKVRVTRGWVWDQDTDLGTHNPERTKAKAQDSDVTFLGIRSAAFYELTDNADVGGRQLRGGVEVESFQGSGSLEAGAADPAGQGHGLAVGVT